MILCSLITALLIGCIGVFVNYKFFKKEITEKLILLSQNYANDFNCDIKAIESSVNTLNHCIHVTFDVEEFNDNPIDYVEEYEEFIGSILKKVAETTNREQGINTISGLEAIYFTFNPELTGNVHEIWYADNDGDGVLKKLDSDPDPKEPYIKDFYQDNKNMRWYYDPIKNRKGVWSDPYEEEDLNIDIVSYTEPIFKDGVLIGVVGMDINIDAMKNAFKNMRVYDTGYAFLMCRNYHFLIHPMFKLEDNLKSIQDGNFKFLSEEIDKRKSAIIRYKLNEETKILGYSHLYNGWIVGFTVPINEVYSSLKTQIFLNNIVLFLSIYIIILIALYLGKSISEPIIEITELIKNTARFSFANDISLRLLIKNKDEIGIMAKEMCKMREILKGTGVDKAARLQRRYLQDEFPLPDKVNMEVLYAPSKTVSGDFYHLERINDNLVIGVLWDVSGKGVTAALNISAVNVLFNRSVLVSENPVDILYDLNIKVSQLLGETYIAACCFSFDFQNNTAKIAGAGINQFIYSNKEEYYQEKEVKGPFLGMFEDSIFDQETICFKPGDKFYFYTDGLEFIFDNKKNRENYIKVVSITEFKDYINDSLNNMQTGVEGIKDDCTLLALEIK